MGRERSFCASLLPLTGNVEEIDGSKRKVKGCPKGRKGVVGRGGEAAYSFRNFSASSISLAWSISRTLEKGKAMS
jgi:hypothetical protein